MKNWIPKDVAQDDLKHILSLLDELPDEDEDLDGLMFKSVSVTRRIRNYIKARLRSLDAKDWADELADDFDEYSELRVI